MADQQLKRLKQGVETWNQWRKEHPDERVDLSGATLSRADLSGATLSHTKLSNTNLFGADLRNANLNEADLCDANLSGADFSGADLIEADLRKADLSGANLSESNLFGANFSEASLHHANLRKANLTRAIIVEANLENAVLSGCSVYGIAAWDMRLEGAKQEDLVITLPNQPMITVDNLQIAQFIYLLLNNKEIREVIDTITSKVVLILGRFTSERKRVLDALREELRTHDYLPILFDFEKPTSRDITETVSTLAHLARFVIADITEAKSIPQELSQIVPFLPSVPIVPLLHSSDREWGMYEHFPRYAWVLPIYHYHDIDELLHSIQERIITPAEQKVAELASDHTQL